MRNAAFSLLGSLGFGFLIATAGCEPVDDGAAKRNTGWDGVLTDHLIASDRDVFIDTDETMTVADGCAKTVMDAHKILQTQCAMCHGDPATARVWGFVGDDAMMKTATLTTGTPPMHYIDVGHPQTSGIFVRAAIARNMPPVQRDQSEPYFDRVTLSQASVLQQWIANCIK